jgi:NAD(P)-dependent dehydrogenase (short-subunit alcohol dehydrogenase family)
MMIEATLALGGLDVLVNNAGVAGPTTSVETMKPEAWEGVILIMSSLARRFGYPNRSRTQPR